MLGLARHFRRRSRFARYSLACAAVLVACLLELAVSQTTGSRYLFIAFSPAVAFAAWYGGFGPGAFAVVLSLVATKISEPAALLGPRTRADWIALGTFAGSWLVVSFLAETVYRHLKREGLSRLEAQRRAGQADRLEHFTAAMNNARTAAEAIEACVQETLYALGADAGALLRFPDGSRVPVIARAVGYDDHLVGQWPAVLAHVRNPITDALRLRTLVIFDSRRMRSDDYPSAGALYGADHEAFVAVPLVTGGRGLAVLRLDFLAPRRFDTDDRQFLLAIAPRAAQAIDRMVQYEEAQRARAEAERERARADEELTERQRAEQALRVSEARYRALATRMGRLHDLSAALSGALTVKAVARALVHHGRIAVGAHAASVASFLPEESVFETLYAEDSTAESTVSGQRFAKVPGYCATAVIDRAEPVFVGSAETMRESYARSAATAAEGGYMSIAALPLLLEGAPVAVLEFLFAVPVNFDDGFRGLLASVAQHCAQALDRARLYESAQRARTDAEAANRLKDEFLSVVSHELRTPLNSMLGWATMLTKGLVDANRTQRALAAIQDNATRQARLVDELLDFSRIAAGRAILDLQVLDLSSLLGGVVESVMPVALTKGVDLQPDLPPGMVVRADVRRLEQVFLNLLGNAVKFTPAGGRVRVRVAARDGEIEASVSDDGVGIDSAFLPYVFDRFRQADATITRNFGGLGLGLSIARQLVEAHKGKITAASEGAGHGATFVVTLPRVAEAVADVLQHGPRAQPVAEAPAPQLDGVQVLIVDDEADAREVMACALAACGAKVSVAERAVEALDMLVHNPVDVLLADIAMPDLDGYTLIRQIRQSCVKRVATIPAAAVTAHVRDDEKRQALDAGFQVHVAKPIDPSLLAQIVHTLVHRRPDSGVTASS